MAGGAAANGSLIDLDAPPPSATSILSEFDVLFASASQGGTAPAVGAAPAAAAAGTLLDGLGAAPPPMAPPAAAPPEAGTGGAGTFWDRF